MTNHRYYGRWGPGLDFESVKVEIVPDLWDNVNKEQVQMVLPHYEQREAVYFDTDTGRKDNNTMVDVPVQD